MDAAQRARMPAWELALTGVAILAMAARASADPMPLWSDTELARFAEVIVMGRVLDTKSEIDLHVDAVYTSVTLEVSRVLKGEVASPRLTFKQLGGTAGALTLDVAAQAEFTAGEDVLVFLERRPRDRSLYTAGLWQGKWRVSTDGTSGLLLAVRDRIDGSSWGALGPARDVRVLERFSQRLHTATTRPASRSGAIEASVAAPVAAETAPALPMARRDAASTAYAPRLRFAPRSATGPNRWAASVTRAASGWNAAHPWVRIVDDGAASAPCVMSLARSGAVGVGSADACGELAPHGSVFAITGRYVERGAGGGTRALVDAFVIGNEANLDLLPSSCVDQIAVHDVGHAIGLRDRGDAGDGMSPVLGASCGRAAPILREFPSRAVSHGDLRQLEALGAPAVQSTSTAPHDLAATSSGSSVILTWRASSTAAPASYVIEAGSAPGLADLANVSSGTAATGLKTSEVAPGTYAIRVRSADAGGVSAASNEAIVTVGGGLDGALGAPQRLTSSVSGSTAVLAWQAPETGQPPSMYVIEVGSRPGAANLGRVVIWDGSTEFRLTGLGAGSYYIRVRAAGTAGSGSPSNETIVTIAPASLRSPLAGVGSILTGGRTMSARGEGRVGPLDALSSAPLVQRGQLIYQGAFRVPAGIYSNGRSTFAYGGAGLAFNPKNNSLFMVGHTWYQEVAEIAVPEIKASPTSHGLATARLLQPFTEITEGRLPSVNPGDPNGILIGGLLPYRDKLYATAYAFYDGAGTQSVSHFVSGQDLSARGDVTGPLRVGPTGYTSGYLGLVPAAWQAALGGPVLNGQCCLNIISRTSYGPALFTIDPTDIGVKNPVPATPLLYYPGTRPLSAWDSTSPNFNGTTKVKGVVFPEGTRSVLFFGRHGLGTFCYGDGAACKDPTDEDKGTHAFPYVYYVWAYDALDLAAVKSGQKQPWDVKPYAIWTVDLPYLGTNRPVQLEGAAYDPATGRIFIAQGFGAGEFPIVHVFTVDTGAAAAPATHPPAAPGGAQNLSFPPRNESLDFRTALEAKYRDDLGRQPSPTYVDIEGSVVWTQEYLRYRVNLCSHEDAVARVMQQVDGAPGPPVCGTPPTLQIQFPPRDQSLAFRNELEAKYRDGLRRPAQGSYVDKEGDVVWTQEYLRYRVTGCGHADAVTRVFGQVDGGSPPATCGTGP